eukprot:CAMPEP_0119102112 /NCGR_PEP_ID=MMETSP1180-20130426/969_1 /TAXON_ID=3052 ORGANISM="Chlamydomonas cf sp, Strain CCMP681" /NCGR_SAMPLE_ID=MMETSP1180 /ASSEMBLY_ACC=CAM_ASM_000741 /LENGTH=129 /DNA_ID=CAMNT_0007086345 /DNA_START=62 /DNA_END=451 /DNA_ORIENTATION=+
MSASRACINLPRASFSSGRPVRPFKPVLHTSHLRQVRATADPQVEQQEAEPNAEEAQAFIAAWQSGQGADRPSATVVKDDRAPTPTKEDLWRGEVMVDGALLFSAVQLQNNEAAQEALARVDANSTGSM